MIVERLNPALRRLWRSDGGLQLGVDPCRAVIIDGLSAHDDALLSELAGSVTPRPSDRLRVIAAALRDAGELLPAPRHGLVDERLEPDARSLSLVYPDRPAEVTLDRRATSRVDVVGAGRVGSTLAGLLAAAGIGDVRCIDEADLRPCDLAPGGVRSGSGSRGHAATAAVVDATPHPLRPPAFSPDHPDLVVLAPVQPLTPPEMAADVARQPHVEVVIRETTAIVGPLVLPGRTACRRCVDLSRADLDPEWPWIAWQLSRSDLREVDPCDTVLAAIAAGLAASHALRWLDQPAEHPLIDSIEEFSLLDLRLRRRAVKPHQDCSCHAATPA